MSEGLMENGELRVENEESAWRERELSQLTNKIGSGATPRGGSNSYKDEGISLIRSQNVLDLQFSSNGLAFIDNEQADALKNAIVELNDILLNITGDSVARACKVPEDILPARVNQHVAIIRANDEKLISDFLLYNLIAQKEELLSQSEIGATRRAITKGMIEKFIISLPPLPEQKAIAEVLSALDDKIDLLHRQNKTLEQMAETLFRQWFVVEAGEDWEEVVITDLFEIRDGTHDSPKQKPFGKSLITSKHIKKYHLDFDSAYLISEEDFIKVNQRSVVRQFDILFSMIGTIGLIYIESNENVDYAIKNVGLFKTSQNKQWVYFTYLWLNSSLGEKFIFESKSGSTQQYISLGSLRNIKFNVPHDVNINSFNTEVKPFFDKIFSNQKQIRTLESLRDTLLPKLMSGEVRVQYDKEAE